MTREDCQARADWKILLSDGLGCGRWYHCAVRVVAQQSRRGRETWNVSSDVASAHNTPVVRLTHLSFVERISLPLKYKIILIVEVVVAMCANMKRHPARDAEAR